MPSNTTRRDFLKVGLGALPAISLGGTVPMLVPKLAFADGDTPGTPIPKDNILVVVQLSGGNDGLNTIVPHRHDAYKKARPKLALTEGLHALDDELSLNRGMTAFKRMWDEGKLAIVNGCGYPNPNRSHFESMGIWHAAATDGGDGSGWIGHYLDHLVRGTQNKDIANNPLLAVNIGREMPMAVISPEVTVPSVSRVEDFGLRFDDRTGYDKALEREILVELQEMRGSGNPQQEYFARQAADAIVSADEIRSVAGKYRPDANYTGGLGSRLRLIAQLISGNFGTRVFYCETGGYDTHANQLQQHENLLRGVADNVEAFFKDLQVKGIDNKVTLMCFSEFGRRVEQNASDGTDHGAAGPMFVAGPNVRGGFHGQHPSLDGLERGDLAFTTDFRSVYASMLQGWLNADASQVLKGDFTPLPLLAGMAAAAAPSTRPAETKPKPDGAADDGMGGGMMMMGETMMGS
jgi:uncharacterized protein (DUF1501 family)